MLTSISLQGQALPVHTFLFPTSHTIQLSQFLCHNSVGGRPRGVRISSSPSCASHLSVQTSATTLVGADLGDYDSALSWDSGRRSASPPRRFANESTSTWHPVRQAPIISHPFGETPVRLSQKTCVCMSILWAYLFTHRPTLDYVHTLICIYTTSTTISLYHASLRKNLPSYNFTLLVGRRYVVYSA